MNQSLGLKIEWFLKIEFLVKNNKTTIEACREIIKENKLSISPRALQMQYYRYCANGKKFDKRCLFDSQTELMFVALLESFSLVNRALDRSTFLAHVSTIKGLDSSWNGSGWYNNFMSRHSQNLSQKTLKALSNERFNVHLQDEIEEFANNFEKIILNKKIPTKLIFNCDETRIALSPRKIQIKGIESRKKIMNSFIEPKNYPCASFIPFINQNHIFMQVIVLPNKNVSNIGYSLSKSRYYTRSNSTLTYYCFTPTGYLNGDIWFQILKKFVENIRKHEKNSNIMLLLDNLSFHTNLATTELCIKNNIVAMYFPKYSTHITQPCDGLVFLNLKKDFRIKYRKKLISTSKNHAICLDLLNEIEDSSKVVTADVIARSWSDCGIIPFDKHKIIERGKKFNGTIESKTIYDDITKMFINVINTCFDNDSDESFPLPTGINGLFLPDEFVDILRKKKNEIAFNKQIKEQNKRKKQLDGNAIKKKQKFNYQENMACFCGLHNRLKSPETNEKTKFHTCIICNDFRICDSCYSNCPEYIILHESDCKKMMKLIKAKSKKS